MNSNGQARIGIRSAITNSPIIPTTTISASLLQSLYGAWNAETPTTLGTSISNVWNGELVGTTQSNSLDSGVYLHLDGVTQSSTIDASIYGVWNGDSNANDSVGTNHGTLMNGATFSTGKTGNAFVFDGINDYVRLPDNSMNLTGDFTISAWVYLAGGGPQTILSNEYYNGTTMKGWGIYIDNASAGQTNRFLQFAVYRNTTSDYTIYQASLNDNNPVYAGLANNAWSHISIVRKSGVDTIIYVNGEKVNTTLVGASANRTLDPLYNTTQYVTIGADLWNSTGTQFGNYMKNGSKIDGLSVWNRALDSNEITLLFNNTTGVQYPYSSKFSVSRDLIGSGRVVMVNGASHSTGYTGTAISLDGVNDYLQFPDNIIDPIKNEFSISFWIKANGTTGWVLSEMTTVNNGQITSEWDRGISLYYYSSGNFDFKSGANGSDFSVTYNLGSRYTVGQMSMTDWNHITLTYKQGSAAKIYFNGVLVASTTTANALTRSTVNSLRIGRATSYYNGSTTKSGYFNGSIDGFTIWNREITQADVSMLYNGKNPNMRYPYSNKTLYGIYDSVGSVNGTYLNTSRQGILMVDGKLDKSFWFDGSSSISIPNNSLNTLLSGDFSVGFWVYATHLAGGTVSPFTYTSVSGTTINGFEMRFSGWSPKFVMYNNNTSANSVILSSSTNIVQNTWNHIVITRKRGSRSKFYLNGALVASNTSTADPVVSGTFIGNIGHNKMTGFNTILAGGSMMDGITTWTKELMDDEVTQLYNAGNGIQAPFTGNLPSTSNQLGVDNGTLMNGCTFTDGKIGKAFTFDGVNDFVQLPNNSLNFTIFSISAWVNPSNTVGSRTILNSANYVSALDYGWKFRIIDGQLSLQIYSTGGLINEYKGGSISTNTWTHVSATRINGSTKLYINGSLVGSQTSGSINNNPNYTTTTYCSIGSLTSAVSPISFFVGSIDSINVWQKELTESEITELYNSGNGKQITTTPIVQSGLVLNLDASRSSSYPNTGTTWTDISGNENNGTMVNGPIFGTANGGGITFDGVNDYANFPVINTGNVFTVQVWAKISRFGGGMAWNRGTLVNNSYNWGGNNGFFFFVTSQAGSGSSYAATPGMETFSISIGQDVAGASAYIGSLTNYVNKWVNLSAVVNGTNPIKLYLNGVEVSSYAGQSNGPSSINYTSNFVLGSRILESCDFTQGTIGSVYMYNRALSATDILQNFNVTKSRFGL